MKASPFNDGWPDRYGPVWHEWQREIAREEIKYRKLRAMLGGDPNADVQFDYEREAEQAGCSITEVDNVKHRQSSAGRNPRVG